MVPKFAVCYTANDLKRSFDNSDGEMSAIIHEARDVVLGHLWKLFLKQILETREHDRITSAAIIVDHSEFDLAIMFLNHRRL